MEMVKQYDIYWISLDPTKGSEINKTRPGVVISPDESNKFLNTVIIAPLTSTFKNFPMRLEVSLSGKKGQIALDQIRSIDQIRLLNRAGNLKSKEIKNLRKILKEYLTE
jgi:mRNA interferase MazF